MTKLIKNFSLLLAIVLIFVSCSNQEENISIESSISVSKASTEVSSAFKNWNNSSKNVLGKSNSYTNIIMFEENNNGNIIYSANSEGSPNEAIGFTVIDGLISNPFKTIANQIDENHIKTEYYDINGSLLFEMIVSRDGELTFQSIANKSKLLEYGKLLGWWSRADECFGQFHNITGSNIGDWLFAAAANTLTLGGYSVGAAIMCAGVASLT